MFCERLRFGCCSLVFADSDQKHLPRQGVSVLPTDRACIQNAPARQFLKKFSVALAVVPLALSRWSHHLFLG